MKETASSYAMAGRQPSEAAATRAAEPEFFSKQITEARRFFLQLSPPWDDPLVIVGGGNEHCAPDYHIVRTDFPYHSVEFVASGEGTLDIAGKRFTLATGDVFAYGPNDSHEIRSSNSSPLQKYFLSFAGQEAAKWRSIVLPDPQGIVQSCAPHHIVRLFEEIIDAGRNETPYRSQICRSIGEHILLRIAETGVPQGTVGTGAFDTFQRCREWIEAHYSTVKTLGDIAEACRVDSAHICRLFKRFSHQSPWQYVIRLKMQDAAEQLQSQRFRVSDVAHALGFEDPFQFSRTFRRVYGVSPRRFVQLQRRPS